MEERPKRGLVGERDRDFSKRIEFSF